MGKEFEGRGLENGFCVSPLDSSSREESWMGKTVGCNSRLWGPSHSRDPFAEQGLNSSWEG